MATRYVDVNATQKAWTTLTGVPVASGDILRISGCANPNHLVIIARGGGDLTGTWVVDAGSYENKKAYTTGSFSGTTAQYKYITGLDGVEVLDYDNTISVTATTSGTMYCLYS